MSGNIFANPALDSPRQVRETLTEQGLLKTEMSNSTINESNMQIFVYIYLGVFLDKNLKNILLWPARFFFKTKHYPSKYAQ